MNNGQLLIGPLGPFPLHEDTHVLHRDDGRWLVSARATRSGLRLSDANPSTKLHIRAAPESRLAAALDVATGRAELFADGLLVAGIARGEWLALAPGSRAALRGQLAGLAGEELVLLTDRSAGLAAFRLTGQESATVLAGLTEGHRAEDPPGDGSVVSTALAGIRCVIVRDDLLPEDLAGELLLPGELLGGELGADGGAVEAPFDPALALVNSFLVLCDRSVARELHAQLLQAGAFEAIEPEGFARYRSYHADA